MSEDEAPPPRKRKVPKKMTQSRLRNITHYYLEQRTTTVGHLRRLMLNRIRKSLRHHEGDEAEMTGWLDALLADLVRINLLNDERWAASRYERLKQQGLSSRIIRGKLREKLVDAAIIDALMEAEPVDPLGNALHYARKRRIGPFREHGREERREKDLAKLVRGGFPYSVAREVNDMEPEQADDKLLDHRYPR